MAPGEFIRRLMLHVLPKGFIASGTTDCWPAVAPRADTIARARKLIDLAAPAPPLRPTTKDEAPPGTDPTDKRVHPCPCCGGRMVIIETFAAGTTPRHRPSVMPIAIRIDTS